MANPVSAGKIRSLRALYENSEPASPTPPPPIPRGRQLVTAPSTPSAPTAAAGAEAGTPANGEATTSRPVSKVRANFVGVEPVKLRSDTSETRSNASQRDSTGTEQQEALIAELKRTISKDGKEGASSGSAASQSTSPRAHLQAAAEASKSSTTNGVNSYGQNGQNGQKGNPASDGKAFRTTQAPPAAIQIAPNTEPVADAFPSPPLEVLQSLAENLRTPSRLRPKANDTPWTPRISTPQPKPMEPPVVAASTVAVAAKPLKVADNAPAPVDLPPQQAPAPAPESSNLSPTSAYKSSRKVSKESTSAASIASASSAAVASTNASANASTSGSPKQVRRVRSTLPERLNPSNDHQRRRESSTNNMHDPQQQRRPSKTPSVISASAKSTTSEPKKTAAALRASPSPAPFVKPRPKSPTRPIKLPSHLIAPTASSAAKHGKEPRTQTLSRRSSMVSDRGPLARSTSTTTRRPAPRTTQVKKEAEPRPSVGSTASMTTAKADDGFLARMMRPTASSASKVHEKLDAKSPPRAAPRKPSAPAAAPPVKQANGVNKGKSKEKAPSTGLRASASSAGLGTSVASSAASVREDKAAKSDAKKEPAPKAKSVKKPVLEKAQPVNSELLADEPAKPEPVKTEPAQHTLPLAAAPTSTGPVKHTLVPDKAPLTSSLPEPAAEPAVESAVEPGIEPAAESVAPPSPGLELDLENSNPLPEIGTVLSHEASQEARLEAVNSHAAEIVASMEDIVNEPAPVAAIGIDLLATAREELVPAATPGESRAATHAVGSFGEGMEVEANDEYKVDTEQGG
ncbi:hypothetical protein EJ06DRAFT_519839 [Trichodelitschia bisporula]|uniref:Uncharacterized protein n=1 Tax=Trichodelitschia bisporula TaxID=703511 RepID=A0A6G1I460_9PEZI|nr:hypothetical protein EJ06DRAFT_519839 [Trichodelitschia bisporula]